MRKPRYRIYFTPYFYSFYDVNNGMFVGRINKNIFI